MGTLNVKPIVTQEQRKEFLYHLLNDVKALEKMIEDDLFEKNIQRIGAEQELCLVTKNFRPSYNSIKILNKIKDPHFTTELGLFNIEVNLDPFVLKKTCFSKLENHLKQLLAKIHKIADSFDGNKIILTGILPTLRKKDFFLVKNMTPLKRYKALNEAFKTLRGETFNIVIEGVDELYLKTNSILFEACNTSFQTHLQIPLDEIVDKYNWAQVIAGPVLAVMTNSPLLLGRELRSETRIAVFQKSLDTRTTSYHLREQRPRVSFGSDWIKNDIIDYYKDDISRFIAILTTDFEENSDEVIQKGEIPVLKALNLHNGTLYKWNRLCYGITDGKPHLRIENRYMPSGPSVVDEIANMAFWVGLMQGMPSIYKEIWKKESFKEVKGNFLNASRTGLDTYFNWFGQGVSACDLIKTILIPLAKNGLTKAGIDKEDITKYLGIIEKRVDCNINGSKWLVKNYRELKKVLTSDEANVALTSGVYHRQLAGNPIHTWDAIKIDECSGISKMNDTLRKVMTTEIFVVHEDDLIELVKNIMEWKNIHHLPVVNKLNKFIGMITIEAILNAEKKNGNSKFSIVKEVMEFAIITADPEFTIEMSKELMELNDIDYLPVIENEELIGVFTKKDLSSVIKKQQ